MLRYLIITFSKINLAENLASSAPGGEVQHVGKRVRVRLCDQIKAVEVSSWPPRPVLLHHPWRGGTLLNPFPL
jgi:hypothetical protein